MPERRPLDQPPRAFISYARSDGEEFARWLRERLEREEPAITLWQDRTDMEPTAWWRQITEALDRVKFMILVLTPASVRSPVVRKEWQYARQQGVCVVPVKADPQLDFGTLPRWLQKTHCFDPEREWPVVARALKSPPPAIRVPFLAPELPDGFVERPHEFSQLRAMVLDPNRREPIAITTALWGAGGLGKTTLATALCHDEEIQAAFDDGILWTTIGQDPNLLDGLTKFYAALTGDRPAFRDVEDAAVHLATKLEDKTCLIVLDDVWNPAHLRPFRRAGKGSCAWLITTRQMDVALDAKRVEVDTMPLSESVALLTRRLDPPPANADLGPFRALAHRLGGWPLLLELAGSALRHRMAHYDTPEGALAHLNRALDKKGVGAFDRTNATERHQSMIDTIEVSAELLQPGDRHRFIEMAIFPRNTDVPMSALGSLWGLDAFDTEECVQRIADLALFKLDLPTGTVRLHDVMRAYLAEQWTRKSIDPVGLHSRLIDAWGDLHQLPDTYAWQWLAHHLIEAGRRERLRTLLLDPGWLRAKLEATDSNALLADFEAFPADSDLRLVQGAIRLSAHILALDKGQLRGQLLGRLQTYKVPAIQDFLARFGQADLIPWFRPLTTSLTPPGGSLLRTLAGHTDWVNAVAMAPDGRRAVSASADMTLKAWDLEIGAAILTLAGHAETVNGVAVVPDGRRAVSASSDRTLKVWDLETGAALLTLAGHDGPIRAVAMAPDGRRAVSASADKTLKVWDLETGSAVLTLTGHTDWVNAVAVTPDGRRAVSASADKTLKVWDLDAGTAILTLAGHTDWVNAAAVPDGRRALSASSDKTLKVWNLETGFAILTLAGHAESVNAVAAVPDGRRALSASDDMTLKVWDLETGTAILTLAGHAGPVHAVVAPDDRHALSASADMMLKVWDLDSRAAPLTLAGHTGSVRAVAMAPDGRRALSASADMTVKVWDLDTGTVMLTLVGHAGPVHAAAVAPDGRRAISASGDMTLKVWDLETGDAMLTLAGHARPVRAAAVTPDGRRALSASSDRTLKVWELDTGAVVCTLAGHAGPVRAVAVAPDGRRALSASDDATLKVWDLDSGRIVTSFPAEAPFLSIAVGPDGLTLVAGDALGRVHFLRIEGI
jgi:WD40 repeat protein